MEWAAVISALLAIVGLVVKDYIGKAPNRAKEDANEKIQAGRAAIAACDSGAVSARLDGVSEPTTGDTPKLGSDEDTARRIAKITGG